MRGLPLDIIPYSAILSACAICGSAQRYFLQCRWAESSGSSSSAHVVLAVSVVTHPVRQTADNAEKSLQLLVEMLRKDLVQDVFTYGALISACAKGDNAVKALQLLVDMQRKGLEPDVITFSALFSACEKSDYNAEKALQLSVEIQRKGLEQDVITHNALIHQCLRSERG